MSESSKGRPILRLIVSAANGADDTRLQSALSHLAAQNTSVNINGQPHDGYYSLEGSTESELDSICDRLRDDYHLAISVGAPTAILLETVRKQAEAEGKYIRQTGGSGNYGHCWLRVEPNEPGKGYEFVNAIKGDVVPEEYIKPIDQGIQGAMELGILAGFPMVDVKVTLFDGSYHETDSNPMAFTFASSIAFKEAAKKASPVLLEPMMALAIEVFEGLAPWIRDEVFAHRGRIEGDALSADGSANGLTEIKAIVPLSELLASSSGRLAEFGMEFAGYEAVRGNGFSGENESGVPANKPKGPSPRRRSEVAEPEPEDD